MVFPYRGTHSHPKDAGSKEDEFHFELGCKRELLFFCYNSKHSLQHLHAYILLLKKCFMILIVYITFPFRRCWRVLKDCWGGVWLVERDLLLFICWQKPRTSKSLTGFGGKPGIIPFFYDYKIGRYLAGRNLVIHFCL